MYCYYILFLIQTKTDQEVLSYLAYAHYETEL